MSLAKRSPLMIAVVLGVAISSLVILGATWSVISAGVFEVSVHEAGPDGDGFTLYVPAAFVHTALKLVPNAIFAEIRSELDNEIGNHWPLILAAARELDKCGDLTLVKVESDDELVTIRKEDGRYYIDVSDGDDNISVVLPSGIVSKILKEVAPSKAARRSVKI